jgi:hypothetical protein
MRVVRILAALITVAGLALVGGCGSGGTARTAAVATDPTEQLLAGIRALNSAPFRIAENTTANAVTASMEGVVDPAHRAMRVTRSESVAGKSTGTDYIALGTDVYLRFEQSSMPGVPAGRWLHIDGRRLKSLRGLGIDGNDMSGKIGLVGALTAIERAAPRELRGTYDPAKVASARPPVAGAPGGEVQRASWRARFDEQNRLAWVSVTLPGRGSTPAVTTESGYSGFGEPVTVERPPAGTTVDAPASLYQVFDR